MSGTVIDQGSSPRKGEAGIAPTDCASPREPPAEITPTDLAEALSAQQRTRWQKGDRVLAEALLLHYPVLQDSPAAFPLIYGEFLLREEQGECPSVEEFQKRFPRHAAQLDQQVCLHRLLASEIKHPVPSGPTAVFAKTPAPKASPPAPKASTSARTSSSLPVVAGYEILGELGRGGMGIVYKARQLGLNRVVALKMLRGGGFADRDFQARFRLEAEAVARLQHPNIVQVFAIGTHESPLGEDFACPFFSQEFVDGGNLAERLGGKPQPPRESAQLVETLARAVHYAHEQGIVHRDLKPANILLSKVQCQTSNVQCQTLSAPDAIRRHRDPEHWTFDIGHWAPKIADFGLAKQFDNADGSPTLSGAVLGTPEYMAPEQAYGTPVGPTADIYALGVILYEMTTGRRPLEGPTPLETLALVREQEPLSLRRLQPKVPRDLETICLRCLRKEPHQRYATALELAEDLGRYLRGEPIRARPVGLMGHVWRWARRRPDMAALAAVLLLTAVAGVCGITAAWLHALAGWHEADAQRQRAVQEETRAEHRQDEAESSLYFSRVTQARLERQLNNPGGAEQLLQACLPENDQAVDRRGWEWHYLNGILHADLLTIPAAHEECVWDLTFSPDGQRLVTAGGSPFRPQPPDRVRIWQVWGEAAGQCVREFPYPRLIRRVVYRPDGRQVAWIGMDGGVRAVDLETGQVVVNRRLPPTFEVPAFSPDGRRYAASTGNGKVGVWELATGAEVLSIQSDAPGPHYLVFSPDGERLVIRARGALYYWDLAADQELRRFPLDDACQRGPAISPDGRLLAQGTNSGLVRIWDLATGQLLQTPSGHAGGVLAVKFSPDSQSLASAGADGTVRLWAVQTGAELLLLRGHQGRVGCLSFHPSGHYLASGSEQPGDLKIWDLTRPQEHVIVKENPTAFKRVEALGFSSDGQTVLVARPTGWLQVSEAATGMDRDFRRVDIADVWRVPSSLVAIRTDGQQMAAVSKDGLRVVKLLDTMDGRELHSLSHAYPVLHMAFSADGRRLATSAAEQKGSGPREVSVWDTGTGQRLVTIPCEPFDAGRLHGPVALSPDGLLLAHTESGLRRGEEGKMGPIHRIQLRDAATGESLQIVEGVPDLIEKLAFSADGRHLAVSLTRGIMVYDVRTGRWLHGKPLNDSTGDLYTDLAFSPDGRRLAAIGREQALIWDVATGQLVLALRGAPPRPWDNGFNPHIAWSPDGRRLAASNWNNTVSIWDSAERQTPAAKRTLYREAEERARKP